MPRPIRAASLVLLVAPVLAGLASPSRAALVSQQRAEGAGLVRAWFNQAPLDPATQRVAGARLFSGSLYVLTSAGRLQAVNAENGAVRWEKRLGDVDLPAYGPSVYAWTETDGEGRETVSTRVGLIVGSTLFVLDAVNGAEVMHHATGGAPATAPAMTETHAFVPVIGGRIIGHPYDQVGGLPVIVSSPGTLLSEPTLAPRRVIWATARGAIYAADPKTGVPAYRFSPTAALSGSPTVVDASMYFSTVEGEIYGMQTEKARPLWKSSIGESILQPVVALGDTVYVCSESPTFHAFDMGDGHERYRVDGLSRFVSASPERVYAINAGGALGVLDRSTGQPVASWPAPSGGLDSIVNTETDRLYFVSSTGLIQCFHEAALDQPHYHNGAPAEPAGEEPGEAEDVTVADDDAFEEPMEVPVEDAPIDDPFDSLDSPTDDAGEPADDPFADDPFADF